MDNTAYIALSRQLALFRDMETTANNIANVNTTGYNASKLMFTSYMVDDNIDFTNKDMAFAHDISNYRDTSKGSYRVTNNTFD